MADVDKISICMGWAESREWWPRYGAKVQQYLAQHLTVPKELDLEFRKAELATETFLIWRELLASAAQRLHEADMPPESEEADELFNEAAELYRSLLWELPLFSQLDATQLSIAYQEQLSFNKDRSQSDTLSFIIRTYFTLSDACRYYDCPGQARGFFRQVFADCPPFRWHGQRLRPIGEDADTFHFPTAYWQSKFRSDSLDKLLILTYVGNGMVNYVLPFSQEAKLIDKLLEDPNTLTYKASMFGGFFSAIYYLVIPIIAYLFVANFTDLSEGAMWMGLAIYLAWRFSTILLIGNLWPIKSPLIAGTSIDALPKNLTEIDTFREDYFVRGLPTQELVSVEDLRRKLMALEARGVRWAPSMWAFLDDLSDRDVTVI